jgi:hypothetical protein
MANEKSKALGQKKMGDKYNRRSSKEPVTAEDKKLSNEHLEDSVQFNKRHAEDHKKLMDKEKESVKKAKSKALKDKLKKAEEFNEDHMEKHEESMKEDEALLKKKKQS